MDIINRILNTTPRCLPPVHREADGFHTIDVYYRGHRHVDQNYSLTVLLERYLELVEAVNAIPLPEGVEEPHQAPSP